MLVNFIFLIHTPVFEFKILVIFAASKFGTIAQQVEQRTENPCVTGSIPVGTTSEKTVNIDSLFFNPPMQWRYS